MNRKLGFADSSIIQSTPLAVTHGRVLISTGSIPQRKITVAGFPQAAVD
jgi:hypothetical protein